VLFQQSRSPPLREPKIHGNQIQTQRINYERNKQTDHKINGGGRD
jgi:hypothetical protein